MEAIKEYLKSEKTIDAEVKALFGNMNIENPNGYATLEDYEDLTPTIEGQTLANIKEMWESLNRQKVIEVDKEKIKELKLACCRCLNFDFEKLDAPPLYSDYQRLAFVESRRLISTKLQDGKNQKILRGDNHFFRCLCCGAQNCISIEEETN